MAVFSEKQDNAIAWTVFAVYEWLVWPLGTIWSGLMDYSIKWSAFAALPILVLNYANERRQQDTKDKPETKLRTIVIVTLGTLLFVIALYYLGAGVRYLTV